MSYLKNKVFMGITVFLVIAVIGVMFFPRVKSLFKSEDTGEEKDLPIMLVASDIEGLSGALEPEFAAVFTGYEVKAASADLSAIEDEINSGRAKCAFVVHSLNSYTYYVSDLSLYDTNTALADEILGALYKLDAMIHGGLAPEVAGGILSATVESNTVNLGKDQSQNFFYTYIMIFALYMVILLYGQMVATSVATEKSSRAMELLVTSADPIAMMFAKVIAASLAGLLQLSAIFGSSLLFYNLNSEYWNDGGVISSIFDIPLDLFVYMLIFFLLGFLIYAFMFGAIGSTASKLEDINTSVMPISFLFIAGFLVVMLSMTNGNVDSTLMKVFSHIPLFSPMAMFTRIAMSTVPTYEIIISILVLAASVIAVGVISAKIYRMGVLLYGTPPKLSAILAELRRSGKTLKK